MSEIDFKGTDGREVLIKAVIRDSHPQDGPAVTCLISGVMMNVFKDQIAEILPKTLGVGSVVKTAYDAQYTVTAIGKVLLIATNSEGVECPLAINQVTVI